MQEDVEFVGAASDGVSDWLAGLGVVSAAAAIRKGEISSESYTTALLQRARTHSDLNAFITIDEEAALNAARNADKARAAGSTSPLLGVPLAVKDSYLTQGLRTTLGVQSLDNFVLLIDQIVTKAEADPPSDRTDLKGIRFAYAPRQYLDLVEPDVETHFKDTIQRLREAGAEVAEVDLGEDFSSITERSTWSIFFHETMEAVSEFLQRNAVPTSFEKIYNGLKPGLKDAWGHVVLPSGAGFSPDAYQASVSVDRPEIQRRFGQALARSGAAALLLPTTPSTAPLIEHQSKFLIAGQEVSDLVLAKHTITASIAGLPGISIPTGVSGNGLPLGLEIDGEQGRDRSLLQLARRVEASVGTRSTPV